MSILAFGCFEFLCTAVAVVIGVVAAINAVTSSQKPTRTAGRRTPGNRRPTPEPDPKSQRRVVSASARNAPPAASRPAKKTTPKTRLGELNPQAAAHSGELGQGLQAHLRTAMGERMGDLAQRDLRGSIAQSVAAHMGAEGAGGEEPIVVIQDEHPIVKALRNPESRRTAIILQEILRRPNFRTGPRSHR